MWTVPRTNPWALSFLWTSLADHISHSCYHNWLLEEVNASTALPLERLLETCPAFSRHHPECLFPLWILLCSLLLRVLWVLLSHHQTWQWPWSLPTQMFQNRTSILFILFVPSAQTWTLTYDKYPEFFLFEKQMNEWVSEWLARLLLIWDSVLKDHVCDLLSNFLRL